MRNLVLKMLLPVLLILSVTGTDGNKAMAQPPAPVSFQVFYDQLSPYGRWIDDAEYGYIWVPYDVEDDFRPYYTNGYWVMTDIGNTWVSYYTWGWAPFHYGRWLYDAYYGWVWIPGYEWAPAWVYWRYSSSYYGWAPLGPGFSITISLGNYYCPDDWWVFLPHKYLYQRRFHHHCIGWHNVPFIIHNTVIINNTYTDRRKGTIYTYGPRVDEFRSATGKMPDVRRVEDTNYPDGAGYGNNTVKVYRPDIEQGGVRGVPSNSVRAPQPVGKPQPVSTNENRLPAYRTEMKQQAQPGNVPAQPVERPVTPRTEPARPAQPSAPVTEPARPQRAEPQRIPPPVQREPARDVTPPVRPQRTEPQRVQPPVQRTEPRQVQPPVQRSEPQRTQPSRPPVQRTEPVRQQPQAQPVRR